MRWQTKRALREEISDLQAKSAHLARSLRLKTDEYERLTEQVKTIGGEVSTVRNLLDFNVTAVSERWTLPEQPDIDAIKAEATTAGYEAALSLVIDALDLKGYYQSGHLISQDGPSTSIKRFITSRLRKDLETTVAVRDREARERRDADTAAKIRAITNRWVTVDGDFGIQFSDNNAGIIVTQGSVNDDGDLSMYIKPKKTKKKETSK